MAKGRWRKIGLTVATSVLVLVWWFTLQPSNNRDWQPDMAVLAHADIEGIKVTVHNIRNCGYRTETDFDVRYYDKTFDLDKIRTAELYMVYWGSPNMAHTMVSFGFEGGDYVCFSIETRKEKGEGYSAVKGLFRQFELIYIAADERDVVRLRTNYRQGEDVYLFRLNATPAQVREFFLTYIRQLNSLWQQPKWYNAVKHNCTTSIRTQRAASDRAPCTQNIIVIAATSILPCLTASSPPQLPLDPIELLTIVCSELAMIFDAPQAAAALLNEEGTFLTVVAEYITENRLSSIGHQIPLSGNLATQHVLEHRAPLPIYDVLNDPRMTPVRQVMESRGTVSMLLLPLLARDEVVGTIGIDLIKSHEFSDEEIRLASTLASSTAQSLAMTRMIEKMQQTLTELQELSVKHQQAELEQSRLNQDLILINRVITATTSAHDPVELLTIICRELAQAFGAPQAAAALLNEEQTSLTVVGEYRTEDRPTALGRVIPVAGNQATQHVLKHREPLPISDVSCRIDSATR